MLHNHVYVDFRCLCLIVSLTSSVEGQFHCSNVALSQLIWVRYHWEDTEIFSYLGLFPRKNIWDFCKCLCLLYISYRENIKNWSQTVFLTEMCWWEESTCIFWSIESPPEPQKPQVLLCFDCPFNL